jgi:hypothetical protein
MGRWSWMVCKDLEGVGHGGYTNLEFLERQDWRWDSNQVPPRYKSRVFSYTSLLWRQPYNPVYVLMVEGGTVVRVI